MNAADATGKALSLVMGTKSIGDFFPLFQQGFRIAVRLPCTVNELLCVECGISHDFVADRITTVFLDSKPVDDLDQALVREGSTIALSAAMPGLVGATMRRGSFYAAMRGGITIRDEGEAAAATEGIVTVKLFNLLLTDLGPLFLARGIVITPVELAEFLADMRDSFWRDLTTARIDGNLVEPLSLRQGETFAHCSGVRLSVEFTP